jgi:hypothetical protein
LAQVQEPGGAGGEARGGRGLESEGVAVKTRTNFAFRIDIWTADGESIVEHVAGVEDYQADAASTCAFGGKCLFEELSANNGGLDESHFDRL